MSATHAVAAVTVATALLDKVAAAPRGDGGGTRSSGTTASHHPQHAAGVAKGERMPRRPPRATGEGKIQSGLNPRGKGRLRERGLLLVNGTVHSVLLLPVRPGIQAHSLVTV